MKTLLALIDFSDVTPRIIDQAGVFAKAFAGDVILMHVMPPWPVAMEFAPAPLSGNEYHARQRQLSALRDDLAERGVNVTAQQFEGSAPQILLEQVELLKPDVVIMGSHGHGALYNLMAGGVAAAILKNSACPVLVVPGAPVQDVEEELAPGVIALAPGPI